MINEMDEPIKDQVIASFYKEFGSIAKKFEIMDLLADGSPMDYEVIRDLQLPKNKPNCIWCPGVYVFIGNNKVYRVGRSIKNSRGRVMQHLKDRTEFGTHGVWDINDYTDKSILLFNVRARELDLHWVAALEIFLEERYKPLMPAQRRG